MSAPKSQAKRRLGRLGECPGVLNQDTTGALAVSHAMKTKAQLTTDYHASSRDDGLFATDGREEQGKLDGLDAPQEFGCWRVVVGGFAGIDESVWIP